MAQTISNTEDILDSRDIIDRIEELEDELNALKEAVEEAEEAYRYHDSEDTKSTPEWEDLQAANKAMTDWEESEEAEELKTLKDLAEEAEGYSSDWHYGETLIHRRYWADYVQELLQDCGDIPRELPHYIAIDWEETASNIEVDYTSIDFNGQEYLMRCC